MVGSGGSYREIFTLDASRTFASSPSETVPTMPYIRALKFRFSSMNTEVRIFIHGVLTGELARSTL